MVKFVKYKNNYNVFYNYKLTQILILIYQHICNQTLFRIEFGLYTLKYIN